MTDFRVTNARVWHADGGFAPGEIFVRGGRIVPPYAAPDTVDAGGALLCPGLVDIHTHGRLGGDFCAAAEGKLREMAADYARHGVTALLPTLASDTPENWKKALNRLAKSGCEGFVGVHLEGRWLSPEKRGAHALSLLAKPAAGELAEFAAASPLPIRKVTFAPELDEGGQFLAACRVLGAHASVGHTNADYAGAMAALEGGADSFTHLFNAMPPLHHRAGGPVAAALTTGAYAELICDGLHVAPEVVRLIYAAKGSEKLILISDSMEGTGCPDGEYAIAGEPAILKDGVARTPSGALAGSTLNLLQGVQNLAAFCGIPFGKALISATVTPAKSLGLEADLGTLTPGAAANFFLLENETAKLPKEVFCRGEKLV